MKTDLGRVLRRQSGPQCREFTLAVSEVRQTQGLGRKRMDAVRGKGLQVAEG